jgi:hypothetical protein
MDFVARRYGRLPHELLDLSVPQWTLAVRAAIAGARAEEQGRRQAVAAARR